MQSIFLFEKKRKVSEEAAREQERNRRYQEYRSKSKIVLANRYKKRVQKLLLSLPDETKKPPDVAQSQSSKHFIINYSTEQQRIQAACNSNKWLDTTPSPRVSCVLRKRERHKEIASDFRYRPNSSAERIRDSRHWQISCLDTSTHDHSMQLGGKTASDYYHTVSRLKTLKSFATFASDKR